MIGENQLKLSAQKVHQKKTENATPNAEQDKNVFQIVQKDSLKIAQSITV